MKKKICLLDFKNKLNLTYCINRNFLSFVTILAGLGVFLGFCTIANSNAMVRISFENFDSRLHLRDTILEFASLILRQGWHGQLSVLRVSSNRLVSGYFLLSAPVSVVAARVLCRRMDSSCKKQRNFCLYLFHINQILIRIQFLSNTFSGFILRWLSIWLATSKKLSDNWFHTLTTTSKLLFLLMLAFFANSIEYET